LLKGRLVIAAKSKHGVRSKPTARLVKHLPKLKLAAAKQATVTLRLPATLRKAILAALASGRQVTLTLTGSASAPGTVAGTAQVTLRLAR
jgi:hypothetical protein